MKEDQDDFIERRIITGMIVSTDFLRAIHTIWNPKLIESSTARTLASWCLDHFAKYHQAPGKDIEGIYTQHLKNGLPEEQAEGIETVLQGLSEDFERKQFNIDYLLDQTIAHFKIRHLKNHVDNIQAELTSGSLVEAEKLAIAYAPVASENSTAIDPFNNSDRLSKAFESAQQPLIEFPKALGEFWNSQLVRDAFVALMGPEKRGKTFWLTELSMRGVLNDCNVALFQAGDMSEKQMMLRIAIWLVKRSNQARYCDELFIPVMDCVRNQTNVCHGKTRESDEGVFGPDINLSNMTMEELTHAYREHPDYRPCHNCKNNQGTIWLSERPAVEPLDFKTADRAMIRFRVKHKNKLRLSTHPNETLSVAEIRTLLDTWERQDGFVPDIIVIDYADILAPDPDCSRLEYRQQQNKIWQRLRRLSQQKHCLVITATQAAASSYEHDTLRLSDFSETKTKYAHVTAMYGLNQTDQEKKMGIMRINELVVREGDFDRTNYVKVLQRLQIGRPFLGSFK